MSLTYVYIHVKITSNIIFTRSQALQLTHQSEYGTVWYGMVWYYVESIFWSELKVGTKEWIMASRDSNKLTEFNPTAVIGLCDVKFHRMVVLFSRDLRAISYEAVWKLF